MLKAAKLAILILLVSLPGASQTKSARFDPDGSFWILGQPPNEFREVSAINLNAKKLKRLSPAGVEVTAGTNYGFKTLVVKRNNLTFTTVTKRNISYSFSGRFLKGGVFAEAELNDESPILEGTITKYRAGKKFAEAKLRFTYFGGT
jgi:hypothetical protein